MSILNFVTRNMSVPFSNVQQTIINNFGTAALFPFFDQEANNLNDYNYNSQLLLKYNPFSLYTYTQKIKNSTNVGLNLSFFYQMSFQKSVLYNTTVCIPIFLVSVYFGFVSSKFKILINTLMQVLLSLAMSHVLRSILSSVILIETKQMVLHAGSVWVWILTCSHWIFMIHNVKHKLHHGVHLKRSTIFKCVYLSHALNLVIVANTLDNSNGGAIFVCIDYVIVCISCNLIQFQWLLCI